MIAKAIANRVPA